MHRCDPWFAPFIPMIFLAGTAGASPVAATIDATRTGPPITPLVFGGFMEPATTRVWAEMLSDRKFFNRVTSQPDPVAVTGGFGRRGPQPRWLAVGPDEFVVMDKANAFVGEWGPRVRLEAAVPHGISQSGLALRAGRTYAGRVALAGSPGARLRLSLVWGPSPGDRQTIAVPALAAPAGAAPAPAGPWGAVSGPPATMAASSLPELPRSITLPPASVTVYAFDVR